MSAKRIEEIKELLRQNRKVYVNELSNRYGLSEVSIRKDLSALEQSGFATRFYGGAELKASVSPAPASSSDFYLDPILTALAQRACLEINDGDSIFIGSGRTCCILARLLKGYKNLTVVTNNITALSDLLSNATRVFLIGGEVTTTDNQTLLSCWEQPQTVAENIFVNKAFTSISGLDFKAGLSVNSIISTHIYRTIPTMAHDWYLLADHSKFDRISMYPVAELSAIQAIISDAIPAKYEAHFREHSVQILNP